MMKNILIEISKETRMVNLSQTLIGVDNENLQSNLVFKFTDEFVEGVARLDYKIGMESNFIMLEKGEENYSMPIKNILTKEGQINMQLVITQSGEGEEIPVFKSNVFYVRVNKSINAETEAPEGYLQWIEIANAKLQELDEALDDCKENGEFAREQGEFAKAQGDMANEVTGEMIEKAEGGYFDGKSVEFIWEGTKLGIRLEGQQEYQFVDLQGQQGIKGDTGEPFKIKKTYSSISEMNRDFNNMEFGDYVMIASTVEEEDNAKLFTRGETEWIYITDFSGAMGIIGPTGKTPHLTIGNIATVETSEQASATITGTDENPILNMSIPKGKEGEKGATGTTPNIAIGRVETLNYDESAYVRKEGTAENPVFNFGIPKGKDGKEAEEEDINALYEKINDLEGIVDKETSTGTNTLEYDKAKAYKVFNCEYKGNVKQDIYQYNLFDTTNIEQGAFSTSPGNYNSLKQDNSTRIRLIDLIPIQTNIDNLISCDFTKYEVTYSLYDNNGYKSDDNTSGWLTKETIFKSQTYTKIGIAIRKKDGNAITPTEIEDVKLYVGVNAPNPDYPQEVETLKGWNLIKLTNCETAQFKVENNKITSLSAVSNDYNYANYLDKDGILHRMSSNYSSYERFNVERQICKLSAGTYTISFTTSTSNTVIDCFFIDEQYANSDYSYNSTPADNRKVLRNAGTITLDRDMYLYVFFRLSKEIHTIERLQIVEGTEKPYLPYNSIGVKRVGKNKFNNNLEIKRSNVALSYWTKEKIPTGIKLGCTFTSGGPQAQFVSLDLTHYVGKTVRMKTNWVSSTVNKGGYALGMSKEDGSSMLTKAFTQTNGTLISFVVPEITDDIKYLNVSFYNSPNGATGTYYINYNDLTITIDNEDITFEPYQERIDYIDLQGNELLSTDKIILRDNHLWLIKNCVKVVLKGSETDLIENITNKGLFQITRSDVIQSYDNVYALSNYYKGVDRAKMINVIENNKDETIISNYNANRIFIVHRKFANDLAGLKQWLSENKPIVYYQLATPIEIDLGESTLKTISGTNNVEILAQMPPTAMSEIYAYDTRQELKSTEWQFYKAFMGTSSNALPSSWNELLITSNVGGEKSSIDIYKEQLVSGDNDVISPGYYLSANSNLAVVFNINTTNNTINLKTANYNGSNVTVTSQYRIYYR